MLLILDIDETLVYASDTKLDRHEDFTCPPYYIYKRPGLEAFVADMQQHFEIAVWTSSSELYAQTVISHIFPVDYPLAFVWARSRCVKRFNELTYEYNYIKDLKKVKKRGYDLAQVLMVDDSSEKLSRNYGNHISIRPFNGDIDDIELELLARYLRQLESVANVRTIEKRHWRAKIVTAGRTMG